MTLEEDGSGEASRPGEASGPGILSPRDDFVVRLVAIGLLAVVGLLVLIGPIDVAAAAFWAAAILVALVVAAVPLERLRNLKSVKAFGVELELAEEAIDEAPAAEATDEGDDPEEEGKIIDLQLRLEHKLAYVAKHVLGFDQTGSWSGFLNIGSLEYDGYLTREDAIAARRLLDLRQSDLKAASADERSAYLAKAGGFVRGIRSTIFHGIVRRILDKKFKAKTRECDRGGRRRPDLQIQAGDAAGAIVFPAFAGGGGFWNIERIQERASDLSRLAEKALIVVPPDVKIEDPGVEGVKVISLDQLAHASPSSGLAALLDE